MKKGEQQYSPQINGRLTNNGEPIGDVCVFLNIGLSAYNKCLDSMEKASWDLCDSNSQI